MKNHITTIIIALVIVAASAWGLKQISKPNIEITDTATTTPVRPVETTEVEVKTLTKKTSMLDVYVEYPQFKDVGVDTIQDRINVDVVKKTKDIFDVNVQELESAVEGFKELNFDMGERAVMFERKIDSTKTYVNLQTGVVSFSFDNYIDTGGAHGNFFRSVYNYDLKTAKNISYGDIFKGEYETFITKYVREQIKKAKPNDPNCEQCDYLQGEVGEFIDSYIPESFALHDGGIVLLYGAYDLGSYAATATGQEIHISKGDLKEFMQKDW